MESAASKTPLSIFHLSLYDIWGKSYAYFCLGVGLMAAILKNGRSRVRAHFFKIPPKKIIITIYASYINKHSNSIKQQLYTGLYARLWTKYFEEKYDQLISLVKSKTPHCALYLCTVCPRGDTEVTDTNDIIQRLCDASGVKLYQHTQQLL